MKWNETAYIWPRIFLLLLAVNFVVSCGGGSDVPPPAETEAPETTTVDDANVNTKSTSRKTRRIPKHKTSLNPNETSNGWTLSPQLQNKWNSWIEEYQNKTRSQKNKTSEELKKEIEKLKETRGNWPGSWKDLGPPGEGDEPPPWAYVPNKIGLPNYCYQWPEFGDCKESLPRWAFNPQENQCDEFMYSGCGGNQNNYEKKLSCEQACMTAPVSGCDIEVPVEEDYADVFDIGVY